MGVCVQGFFFFFGGRRWKHHNSQHPSKSKKLWEKVLHITKHDLLKHNVGLLLCLCWVIRVQQWVKELNDRRILTELAHCSVTEFDQLVCFCSSNELYSMCVMCQELIRMLDELVNCSQCTFPQSHGSSDLDSFTLILPHYTGRCYLPGCIWGILHCWNWFW